MREGHEKGVIPAKAGIQRKLRTLGPRSREGDERGVIPAKAGIQEASPRYAPWAAAVWTA